MLRPSCRQQSISVFTALILLGLRARFDIRGGYWLFFFILDDVLHDQRNAAIRRIQGFAGFAQSLIGETLAPATPGRRALRCPASVGVPALARSEESSQFP